MGNKVATELLSKYKVEQKQRIIGAFALVYWLLSFWWERFAFYEGAAEARPVTHIVIKLLTLITVYLTALFFTNAVQGFKARGAAAQTLIYALPLFIIVTGFWAVCGAYPFTAGDQFNILESARYYETMKGFFNYWTMYIPMIAMNIAPFPAFAVVFKIWLMSLAAGYCVYRLVRVTGSKLSFLLYLPFLLPPGLYQSYSIHRCPMYAVLYLLYACVLTCDHLEKKTIGTGKFLLLSFMTAVLTQWRSEGIYLLVLGPVLLYFTYKPTLDAKKKAAALAAMLLVQLAVYLPSAFDKEENGHRALPFFEYLITSMERNGLDKEKNAADLAIVNRYISVDAIHELNERQGDYNYNDNIIIYYGLVPGATDQDKVDFQNAVIRLMIHNPLVYIRSQIGAWLHISNAFQYERTLDYAANIFKNLYVPTAWLIGLWVYMLVKKQWCYWFITSGHLCHMAITTALLPAAYFKYYYSEYMYAALTATLAVCFLVKRHREKKSRTEA